MREVIGVKFRLNNKTYYFSPGDLDVRYGNHVIVETAHGIEMGKVVIGRKEIEEQPGGPELRPVIRIATQEDLDRSKENREKARKAYRICKDRILARNLEMKLISAEYSFDNAKLLFFFTADGRVDFRELVRDLASAFHTRIELRQVGIRDEARIAGGMGMCGRELCCHAYLSDFVPVSIKMAKEQNLSLNPSKISGVCGRLMCCLKNEQETYEYLNAKLPKNGEMVTTFDGITGQVCGVSVLRQTVRLMVTDDDDNREIMERKVEEITGHGRKPRTRDAEAAQTKGDEGRNPEEENGRVRLRSRGQENKEQEAPGGRNENKRRNPHSDRKFEKKGDNRRDGGEGRNDKGGRNDRHENHNRPNRNMKNGGGRQDRNQTPNTSGQDQARRNNHRRRRKPDNNGNNGA